MGKLTVLAPLPSAGFDPTETAIAWRYLTSKGVDVIFATPDGQPSSADEITLTGKGLSWIARPFLAASAGARHAYEDMRAHSKSFQSPLSYDALTDESVLANYHGLYITGGHDKRMRVLIESPIIHRVVVHFFDAEKPVAAICHGVLTVARSLNSKCVSVLHNKKTTGLLRRQEELSIKLGGKHYQTYRDTVQDELEQKWLARKDQFIPGKRWVLPFLSSHAFVCQDGQYLSARWPGDAAKLAHRLWRLLAPHKVR